MSDIAGFTRLRLLDTKSQANIDLREAPDSAAGEAVKRNARLTIAWTDAALRIVEWHKAWPVLVDSPPRIETVSDDLSEHVYRASQQIAWLTQQEYRAKFGDEPPTAPILAMLASVYSDHPDYREEWRP